MAYQIDLVVNGFNLGFGNMGLGYGLGLFIDFTNDKIKKALEENDPTLTKAIQTAFSNHELIESQYMMDTFEVYYLQGHGWHSLMQNYPFRALCEFKEKAELILSNQDRTTDYQREVAQNILDTLNGNSPIYKQPEKSPEEKAKSSFERKKPKLRTKLVIRDGYKCDNCGKDKEDSLCIVQKEAHQTNYELDNLTLRCRSCMKKNKNKK